jgi:hypothetical protein
LRQTKSLDDVSTVGGQDHFAVAQWIKTEGRTSMEHYESGKLLEGANSSGSAYTLPVAVVAGMQIGILTVGGIALHQALYGGSSLPFCLLSLFLSLNLVICFWELCLFLRRDYIEARHVYWVERQQRDGTVPALAFLSRRITFREWFSPTVWADVWATYSLYDGSYADRRTYGFNADVGNGFVTLAPSLLLHLGITIQFLPARVLGIIGIMMCWQWLYCTAIYWVSFFMAGRHQLITRRDMNLYIWGTNAPWALFSLLGLYVSIRLVLDGHYGVLSG